ncbi:hypothetical protein BRADI_4g45631v3 [Brachypodium distachyon]|uniref:CCHC-type domain-containing protein n=1 Tax=Brachypodium distachyon TaxID=15368 RepID=A0A2K2CUF5_BRADI|nr:hypothetical protein BRADI_4g45631v3 [Brachypodium distachyon]
MVNKTTSFKKAKGKKGNFKKGGKTVATPAKKPKSGPKPDTECFYCKGTGHWKRNCPKYLADKKAGNVKENRQRKGILPTTCEEEGSDRNGVDVVAGLGEDADVEEGCVLTTETAATEVDGDEAVPLAYGGLAGRGDAAFGVEGVTGQRRTTEEEGHGRGGRSGIECRRAAFGAPVTGIEESGRDLGRIEEGIRERRCWVFHSVHLNGKPGQGSVGIGAEIAAAMALLGASVPGRTRKKTRVGLGWWALERDGPEGGSGWRWAREKGRPREKEKKKEKKQKMGCRLGWAREERSRPRSKGKRKKKEVDWAGRWGRWAGPIGSGSGDLLRRRRGTGGGGAGCSGEAGVTGRCGDGAARHGELGDAVGAGSGGRDLAEVGDERAASAGSGEASGGDGGGTTVHQTTNRACQNVRKCEGLWKFEDSRARAHRRGRRGRTPATKTGGVGACGCGQTEGKRRGSRGFKGTRAARFGKVRRGGSR